MGINKPSSVRFLWCGVQANQDRVWGYFVDPNLQGAYLQHDWITIFWGTQDGKICFLNKKDTSALRKELYRKQKKYPVWKTSLQEHVFKEYQPLLVVRKLTHGY
jgi:hypothetical protein